MEQQTEEVKTAIEEKMKSASTQRDENIKKMLERLKEHVSLYISLLIDIFTKKKVINIRTLQVVALLLLRNLVLHMLLYHFANILGFLHVPFI